ncbi:MAG TPA: UDP-2,4-diacetamido-2,4,6-trideoxy-beta-L-altropyranose hydrolase [Flavisolibacter sp.]|nr:UDP-2,4-diacetamido-2,4,6-trideoxy-beta-L-altropyranose hydrolase [Flavisolibacter sp.]
MRIIFRADGNSSTGLGHIMRSVALMQMLSRGFKCEFWTRNMDYFPLADVGSEAVLRSLDSEPGYTEEARLLGEELGAGDIVVLDGYQFETSYQNAVRSNGAALVCVDDIMSYHFTADMVINHAGGLSEKEYSAEAYTKFCLGPAFALVKPLFNLHRGQSRDPDNKSLLVALGGADPHNDTARVLSKLADGKYSQIKVVLGAANKHLASLSAAFGKHPGISFHQSLTAKEMCSLMIDCPYAVLSPSTVCYEYMTLGGMVYLYQIADNQQRIKEYFLSEQLACDFEHQAGSTAALYHSVRSRQQEVFDGESPRRLLERFNEISKR